MREQSEDFMSTRFLFPAPRRYGQLAMATALGCGLCACDSSSSTPENGSGPDAGDATAAEASSGPDSSGKADVTDSATVHLPDATTDAPAATDAISDVASDGDVSVAAEGGPDASETGPEASADAGEAGPDPGEAGSHSGEPGP